MELKTASEIREAFRAKQITASELTRGFLKKIRALEGKVHAFMSITEEEAVSQAKEIDEMIARGKAMPILAGVPVAIKDNICMEGVPTTCSSKILENFIPPYNASVVEKIKKEKMIIVGKTNMDEFAMGSSTENSAFGTSRNPWNPERVPGGSSGGSAAAVASGEAVLAIGSDTGGSIRQPAGLCGVVGIKPTYGRVSRYGLVAFASSLDQIGTFSRDIKDSALLLEAISGYDNMDSTSVKKDVPRYSDYVAKGVKGLRLGLPREYFGEGLDKEVEESVMAGARILEKEGAVLEKISLPHTEYGVATYYIVATAEASSNLARYDGIKYGFRINNPHDLLGLYEETRMAGFGNEVKRRIMLGTYVLSAGYYDAYYLKALKVRRLIKQDFDKAFEKVDAILTPTSPSVAFKMGEKVKEPLKMYLSDIYTISANLVGIPAVSLPCGFSKDTLPIGIQFMAKPFNEEMLFQIGGAFQSLTDYHLKVPSL